jgi:hypothetical protein
MGLLKKKVKDVISFWPWTKENIVKRAQKKKEAELKKPEEMLQLYLKYIPQLRAIMSGENPNINATDGTIIGRMYDFYADFGGTQDNFTGGNFMAGTMPHQMVGPEDFDNDHLAANGLDVPDGFINPKDKDKRKVAKPVDVVGELETVPTPFTLEGLDEKIQLFKDKNSISVQRYAKDQIKGFLKRLENRKKYKENIEFFSSFPNTTDDKIDKLLANYKLEMNESELFIPTFPKEAIDVMKKYTQVCEKLFGEKPVFYVIADEKDFRKKREKLDPILLVQSPFGFYWQMLGFWDLEMLLISEL